MITNDETHPDSAAGRLTWFVCAMLIAIAAAASLADITRSDKTYSPQSWPSARPPQLPFFSANDRSRWCTVWALVERGTYQIDEISQRPGWDTIDKVRWKGHFYSSKPALLPTLVAGVYATVKRTTGWTLDKEPHAVAHAVLIIVNWLPWLVSLVLIADLASRYARTGLSVVFVVAVASFATLLTPFLITLNNHSVATWSVVFAICPAARIIADGRRDASYFAISGFFAAFAVTNELPAFVFGAALFFIMLRHSWRNTLIWFVPAALIPIGGFIYTTYLASGGVIPFYAYFGTEVYEYVHEGVPSYWVNPQGIDAGTEPLGPYLMHCLIGHHGIFSLSPVFLLTVAGWLGMRRWREFPLQSLNWLGLGLTLWMLLFIAVKTDNYGGNTSGLRWVFWLIPFWLITMLPVVDEWGHKTSFRVAGCLLLAVSVFSASFARANPWESPWLMNVMRQWGWIDYRTPIPIPQTPLNCWIPSLPDPEPEDGRPPFAEFTGVDQLGQTARLRLTSGDRQIIDGRTARRVEVVRQSGYGTTAENREQWELFLDEEAIASGKTPPECLLWPAEVSQRQQRIAEIFLQGMPSERKYYYHRIVYLKTMLQDDALPCRTAASQIRYTPDTGGRPVIYRRQLWLSDRVPFGVVQFEDTITDETTQQILHRQKMTIQNVSQLKPAPEGDSTDP